MAAFAQAYAEDCAFVHSASADRMNLVNGVSWVGENLYVTPNRQYEGVTKDAIQAWYNERSDYSYETNTCMPGKMCGHYRQVSQSKFAFSCVINILCIRRWFGQDLI